MSTGLTKGHATWSSIPLQRQNSNDLDDLGGTPQKFVHGPDVLAPWINQPRKYNALKKIIHQLRQLYNDDQIQMCINVCKLGGWTRAQFVSYIAAQIAALSDDVILKDGSVDFTGVQAVFETPTNIPGLRSTASAGTGIRIDGDSQEIALIVDGSEVLLVDADGKVTMPGVLDPSCVVIPEAASSPVSTGAGEGTYYVRNNAPTSPAFEKDDGTDVDILTSDMNLSDLKDASDARTNLEVDRKTIYGQLTPQDIAINSTSLVNLLSKSISLAAGDVIEFDAQFLILNNSGAARSFVYRVNVGSFDCTVTDGATIAAHATNRAVVHIKGSISIVSSSRAYGNIVVNRYGPAAASTDVSAVLAKNRSEWATTTNDHTGSQNCQISCMGNNATATQTATVISARITKRQVV